MSGLKRIGLFLLTNFLVIITLSVIVSISGIRLENYSGLLVLCAVFGFAGSLISLLLSKTIVKASYKIQIIDSQNASGRLLDLYRAIHQMSQQLGFRTPEVGIYPSAEVNAFATGASANKALVAFSQGIVERLDDDELAAVAGHELSHIGNGDMITMTLLTGVANTFVMFFARVLASVIANSNRDNRGGMGYFGYYLIVMLLENVMMLLAYIPISAFSRWREYGADAGAADLVGAGSMINALAKIDRNYVKDTKKDSFAMAKIENRHRVSLWSTHPSIEARIKRLQARI
ncbi:MAG TPA: protease HtpX [Candidatus Cloacimonadota bacterium]|nr:protease HtpX [Candidatus Cloacimonadota bacterium]